MAGFPGIDVNIKDELQITPLHDSVAAGHHEIAMLLLIEADADPSLKPSLARSVVEISAERMAQESDKEAFKLEESLMREILLRLCERKGRLARSTLHWAAHTACIDAVKKMLSTNADFLNLKDNKGQTALMLAADGTSIKRNKLQVVRLLLEARADVNICDLANNTALHISITSHFIECSLILLEEGTGAECKYALQLNKRNNAGSTALYSAVLENQYKVVQTLIDAGAELELYPLGELPLLHLAAALGNSDILSCLISAGVDINMSSDNGRSALHTACIHQQYNSIQRLVDAGAILSPDTEGDTPLHLLIRYSLKTTVQTQEDSPPSVKLEMIDIVESSTSDAPSPDIQLESLVSVLMDKGAEVNATNKQGLTILHDSVKAKCKPSTIRLLLQSGAKHSVDTTGRSALMEACSLVVPHKRDVLTELLSSGADVNARDGTNNTALHILLDNSMWVQSDIVCMQILLDAGAGTNIYDSNGYSPLHVALSNSSVQIQCIELLLKLTSSDTKSKTITGGKSLLHLAVNSTQYLKNDDREVDEAHGSSEDGIDRLEVVRTILEDTQSVDVADDDGKTPLLLAVKLGNAKCASLLIANGADVHVKENRTTSLPDIAVKNKDICMLQLLLDTKKFTPLDLSKTGPTGMPLDIAYTYSEPDFFTALAKAGVDVYKYLPESQKIVEQIMQGFFAQARKMTWVIKDINDVLIYNGRGEYACLS